MTKTEKEKELYLSKDELLQLEQLNSKAITIKSNIDLINKDIEIGNLKKSILDKHIEINRQKLKDFSVKQRNINKEYKDQIDNISKRLKLNKDNKWGYDTDTGKITTIE